MIAAINLTTDQLRTLAQDAAKSGNQGEAARLYRMAAERHPRPGSTDCQHLRTLARQHGCIARGLRQ